MVIFILGLDACCCDFLVHFDFLFDCKESDGGENEARFNLFLFFYFRSNRCQVAELSHPPLFFLVNEAFRY